MEDTTNTVTKRERDCLIMLEEDSQNGFPMRLHQIASTLGIKPPTALNVIKRLEEKGLAKSVEKTFYSTPIIGLPCGHILGLPIVRNINRAFRVGIIKSTSAASSQAEFSDTPLLHSKDSYVL